MLRKTWQRYQKMIQYRKRRTYKYNLLSDLTYLATIDVDIPKTEGLLRITSQGELLIKTGYSWDGPSGPTIDTKNFMSGSLVHDALYQLMREGFIQQSQRKRADEILRDICLQNGMSKIRAFWVFLGVRIGGASAAKSDLQSAPF